MGVKSNDVDKSEGGGRILLKLCGLRKWMVISCDLMMFNLLVFICCLTFVSVSLSDCVWSRSTGHCESVYTKSM